MARVACGIMMGFVINLVIASIGDSLNVSVGDIGRDQSGSDSPHYTTLQFILGAPVVPSIVLMVAVYFCYESPRFYMRQHSPNFNPKEALRILEAIRPTKVCPKGPFHVVSELRLTAAAASKARLHHDSMVDEKGKGQPL